jgi:hypothetical protein
MLYISVSRDGETGRAILDDTLVAQYLEFGANGKWIGDFRVQTHRSSW